MAKGYNRPRVNRPSGGRMGNIRQVQEQMAQAQAELSEETATATVGGGVISITMTGNQVCKEIKIAPELLEDADVEMLQDLITSGFNAVLDQSRSMAAEKMKPFTEMLGGLGLGGM